MEHYKRLLQNLSAQTGHRTLIDGFPSGELRTKILRQIQTIMLPEQPPEEPFRFMPMNQTGQIRGEYLRLASEAGKKIAREYSESGLRETTPPYLRNLILVGAQSIGGAIGREYGGMIYPELRRLQVDGIDLRLPVSEPPPPGRNYTFSVTNYGNCLEFSEITMTGQSPGSEIIFDEMNDRYIETFVFQNLEDADSSLEAWERHNQDRRYPLPVKYGFTVEQETPADLPEISSIIHFPVSEESSLNVMEDGFQREVLVFPSCEEAEQIRKEKLALRKEKGQAKKLLPQTIPEQEKSAPPSRYRRQDKHGVGIADEPLSPVKKTEKKKHFSIGK